MDQVWSDVHRDRLAVAHWVNGELETELISEEVELLFVNVLADLVVACRPLACHEGPVLMASCSIPVRVVSDRIGKLVLQELVEAFEVSVSV